MSGMPSTVQNSKEGPYGAMFCSHEKLYFGKIFNNMKYPHKISKGKEEQRTTWYDSNFLANVCLFVLAGNTLEGVLLLNIISCVSQNFWNKCYFYDDEK